MLIKMVDHKSGDIVWGDAGDIEQRFTCVLDEDAKGTFVVGSAKLDDGRRQPLKKYYGEGVGVRRAEVARNHVLIALMIENAHARPRPSAEAIAEHVRERRDIAWANRRREFRFPFRGE